METTAKKMMQVFCYPEKGEWENILKRPETFRDNLNEVVDAVFQEVKKEGDKALRKYTWFFDRVRLERFKVDNAEFEMAQEQLTPELQSAIRMAEEHITQFHRLQLPSVCDYTHEKGFRCWQESRPVERVGLYIPGGSAPLFSSVLMLGIPARLAGCREITLCTPPGKDGKVDPAILWTARLCGVTRIFKLGGIQAIAAMTFGTESVGRVDKIFGPGNIYVTAAKQQALAYGLAIDMPAGPSELMVVADETAVPAFVAADLLSQAEHGGDSQVLLLTCNKELPEQVEVELRRQLNGLPREAIIRKALSYCRCVVLNNREECLSMINAYAPEHLMLSVGDYPEWIPGIQHAGSVFLGNYSPESAGDYASGTNHTLPTGGFSKTYSGVGVEAFMKKISFQEITPAGLEYLGDCIEEMAVREQLEAHRNAVEIRREKLIGLEKR